MAYQTGTFTSLADLHTTITNFCVANGWASTSGILSKAGVHVKLDSTSSADYLLTKIGTGDDGLGALTNAGSSFNTSAVYVLKNFISTITFPATYHLISLGSPDAIFLIINYNVTDCQHLAFGNCLKYGNWVGGQFLSATAGANSSSLNPLQEYSRVNNNAGYNTLGGSGAFLYSAYDNYQGPARSSSLFNADFDGVGWRANVDGNAVTLSETFGAAALAAPFLKTLNPINLQPTMGPCLFVVGRPAGFSSIVGSMPHIRYLRVDNYQPGDVISVGSQKWIVFPHRNVTNHNGGWAIKYDGP